MSAPTAPTSPLSPRADEKPSRWHALSELVGGVALDGLRTAQELYSLLVRTLYYCVKGRREKGDVLKQAYELGNRSLGFLFITMGFIGMILFYQSASQLKRVFPENDQLGATYIELMVRDLGASLGAMMLATRVGAGIAAELGSMVVTEQVDALRMSAADPVDFLVVPRFLASMVMTFMTLVLGTAVAILAGYVTGMVFFEIRADVFFNLALVDWGDVILGCTKALTYGAAIPIVSAHAGFAAHGGSEGVGWATTRAVVNSSLAILTLNALISTAGFMVFPG